MENIEQNVEQVEKPAFLPTGLEMCCLSVLLGECAGVIYVLGNLVMRVLNWW